MNLVAKFVVVRHATREVGLLRSTNQTFDFADQLREMMFAIMLATTQHCREQVRRNELSGEHSGELVRHRMNLLSTKLVAKLLATYRKFLFATIRSENSSCEVAR